MELGVPVIPLLLEGAYELWPSGSIFTSPGHVNVSVLEPIPVMEGMDHNKLSSIVRRRFLDRLLENANKEVLQEKERGRKKLAPKMRGQVWAPFGLHALWVPACYAVLYALYRSVRVVVPKF
jgi:1-acyl-sn-glycerol-3-phosphate acyltransferase